MQTQMTEAGPFERMLTLTLEEAELDSAKDQAARKLSEDLKIDGFRPGKAPRAVVERMVGEDRLKSEAIDEALPEAVGDAIRESELAPVTTPRVEDIRERDDGGVEVDVRITLWPTIDDVPDFTGREVIVELPSIEDGEVDDQVERLRSQFAELEDVSRAADEGDFVMINFSAMAGGSPIEDASADDLLYEVGSGSFVEGLDGLVLGSSAGDIRKGPGVLPEGFGENEGEVTLSILVKGVKAKKLPEVSDDWVSDVSEFESVDEMRSELEKNLYAMKLQVTGDMYREQLLDGATDELDLELPEPLVEAEMEASLHNLAHTLESSGIDFANYLNITGQDQDTFSAEIRDRAERALKTRVLLEAVASEHEIEVEEEELSAAIEALAAQAGEEVDEVRAALAQSGQVVSLAGDILRRKALNHILEQATPVDEDGEPVDLTPPGFAAETEEADEEEESATAASEEPDAAEDEESADE